MLKNNIKFAFFGTPEVASETLEILKQSGFLPALIVTAPDRPVGRKQIITPPSVKVWAKANNIPVLQPEKLTPSAFGTSPLVRGRTGGGLDFDLFIVVAYGQIFPEWLINTPKLGTLNIHYSLLPKYRGAAPVQTAILNGDIGTGVTIQKMVRELDAGPIIAQEKVEILPDEKTPELLSRLIKIGGELLVKTLPDYFENKIIPIEQNNSNTTFAPKIKKEDGLINLSDNPIKNFNKFRAFYDWPRVYFIKDDLPAQAGKRIIISDAEIKDNLFLIKKVIPEGKNEMPYSSFN